MDKTMKCDVLVIGGGIAACFAAIKAAEAGASVVMADKGYVGRSGQSPYADSFLVFDPNTQNIEAAMEEINRHSEYLNNRFWTRTVLENSAARYQDLLNWGCQFTGEPNTVPGAPPSGVQFDKTKGAYGEVLRRQCRKSGVQIVDQVMIVEFLKQGGRIRPPCFCFSGRIHAPRSSFPPATAPDWRNCGNRCETEIPLRGTPCSARPSLRFPTLPGPRSKPRPGVRKPRPACTQRFGRPGTAPPTPPCCAWKHCSRIWRS
jgi:hypothetical protein